MALHGCPVISDSSLEGWEVIGSGGFGQIFRARYRQLCCDVAIKLLHYDDGTSKSLLREIDMMRQGSSPYVIHVYGVFKGRAPSSCSPSTQLGLVMEVMERGSLASMQEALCETPPWPLVFRLAHQVALGTNFLHSQSPPLLHLDLKPSNVLLDASLNAKLTDFGLARTYHSVSRVSKKDNEEEGGTISYMPPEAFDISYSPSKASDIYSYGILLWSIITGKQPYANAMSSIVRLRIPQGDRPSLEEIRDHTGRAGLAGLMELMKKCWEAKRDQRPTAFYCTNVTEELYKMHKHAINDAVHEVLNRLDRREEEALIEQLQGARISPASGSDRVEGVNVGQNVLTGRPPIQEMAGGWTANQRDPAKVRDPTYPRPSTVAKEALDLSSTEPKVKMSSVHPIQSTPPPSPSTRRSPQAKAAKPPQRVFTPLQAPQYKRQFSSPETFSSHHHPAPIVNFHLANVIGLQYGDNNNMHIYTTDLDRKRHPTAPSSVNLPPPHVGSRRDTSGGAG